jgi:hypothetical protein
MVILKGNDMREDLDIYQYSEIMSEAKLITWNQLPEFAVYCDQMLQIVRDGLRFMQISDGKLITKSMVNNYVKWDMIPKPEKKKYEKLHIACVIVITILKQVLPISSIKTGIKLQIVLQGQEKAYDSFCEVFEKSMKKVFVPIVEKRNPYVLDEEIINYDNLAISSITAALANKLLTEKIIETKIKKHAYLAKIEGDAHE